VRTLVLTLEYPTRASYYEDWRDAFRSSKIFDVTVRNVLRKSARRQIAREIGTYELVVVLHSCSADTLDFVRALTPVLQSRRGRLVTFLGNEVNLPWAPLADKIAWLIGVEPDIIATQLLAEAGEWLYAETGRRVISLPHALNPTAFRPIVPQGDRLVDIGARSWRYLAYLGDDDRNRIYDYFASRRFEPSVTLDFSTEQRFDREGWAAFLNRCKATVATEAGSWYLDRNDATVMAIRDYVVRSRHKFMLRADSPLSRLARRLPYGAKTALRRVLRNGFVGYEAFDAEQLDFAEIHRQFFAGRRKAPVYSKCVSSRHFDAIGCKTLQIMFPGRYGDILRAGEHYLALNQDFSNVGEVLDQLRSVSARERIINRAYEHVVANHTYTQRLQRLEDALGQAAPYGASAISIEARRNSA
jgi:spore maturation protein CgeB